MSSIVFLLFRTGRPSQGIRYIKDDSFNSLYQLNDKGNYRIFRWVNSSIVKMVSDVYKGNKDKHVEQGKKT